MTEVVERPQPNHRLRHARLARQSPSGSGLPLSRQELAEAANAWVYAKSGQVVFRDGRYIGRLERGLRHWPHDDYRAALRAILGVATDAELGFYTVRRRSRPKAEPRPVEPTHRGASCAAVRAIRLHECGADPASPLTVTVVGLWPYGPGTPASRDRGRDCTVAYHAVVLVSPPAESNLTTTPLRSGEPDTEGTSR